MIIGGVFCALVIFCFIQSYRINSYKAELAESTAQVSILASDIEISNKSYAKLSEDSAKRVAEAAEAIKKANLANGINAKNITSLKSQIGKISTCDSAADNAKSIL
jgi:hypothetical protein